MPADLVIRGATVVTETGADLADIAIEGETITAVGKDVAGAETEINAEGLTIFPGMIDVHLHFNEPGRADWEGATTGSRALAAGGGTAFFDMPLNSTPCTVNKIAFERKHAALAQSSITDFGIWGGIIPGNLRDLADLADAGVVGFKAFMCDSGLPEFPRADDLTLYEGMQEAKKLDLVVAVHAENEEIVKGLGKRLTADNKQSIRDFLDSRPVIAEVEAIHRAAALARETGARLHIVHISSGKGVVAALQARTLGAQITIETCPHYLFFTEEDVERLAAIAKCAPPLRTEQDHTELWDRVRDGSVDIVASDHSPAPPDMKGEIFWKAWGGIAGVQSTLPVLLDSGHFERGVSLSRIAQLTATEPARRFRLPRKGSIAPGNDADLTFIDLNASYRLKPEDLYQRYKLSPYMGSGFRGSIQRTIRRGETIFHSGAFQAKTKGQFLRPTLA
jgi:allantoinase